MTFQFGLILITSASAAMWLGFLYLVKNIKPLYPPPGSDSERTVRIAAGSDKWKWSSDMHTSFQSSSYMKDVTVILLVLFQKIFRDKQGLFPITALHSFSTATSAILIYLISKSYWNPTVGLILGLLFLTSFWPWQISLFVGHVNIATMFFLAAVFLFANLKTGPENLTLAGSGIFTGLLLFSSSSSFKYLLPLGAAFIFAVHENVLDIFGQNWPISPLVFFIILVLPFLFVKVSYKKILSVAYEKRGPVILKKIIPMKGAEGVNLEHYVKKAEKKLAVIQKVVFTLWILLSLLGYLTGPTYLIPFLIGALAVFLILTLPNIPKSMGFYLEYVWYHANQATGLVTGFVYFKDFFTKYFASKNMKAPEKMRGGLRWLPRLFWRMAPVHTVLWATSVVFVILFFREQPKELLNSSLIVVVSLSPIIWGEITKSPQLSRTYFPGLVCMFLLVGYSLSIIYPLNGFVLFSVFIVSITFIYNIWRFFSDIYPARMTITNVLKVLDELGIKEFYTLKTGYQYGLIDAMGPSLLNDYNIERIDSLQEIGQNDGWLLIPGTSSKAAMPEIDEIKNNKDLTNDANLNKIIKSREIEKIAGAKFKTFGTSDIFTQEGEVPSYRDLILNEITKQDRFYGYAWLVKIDKLKKAISRL